MIDLLDAHAYGSFLEHVEGGRDACTHRALVWFHGSTTLAEVHAKLYLPGLSPRGMVNEVIGHILATAAGLAVPRRAAILRCSTDVLARHYPQINWSDAGATYPLWCTQSITGRSPAQLYKINALNTFRRDAAKWPGAPQAVAFDAWIANVDRNLGNVLRTGKASYALIDHGRACTGATWSVDTLDPDQAYINILARTLWGDALPPKSVQGALCAACDAFPGAMEAGSIPLDGWLSQLLDAREQAAVTDFLHARAQQTGGKMRADFGHLPL